MIPEVNPYNNYRGDGVATLFDYDFFIQNGSQLIVEHIDENDIVTRLEENIDYEIVVIEEEFAGYIKFPIEDSKFGILQESETLSLQLTLPFEQISEYGQSSLLDLNSIEFSLDYLTRLCQILKRQMERSVRVNEGSEATPEQLLETINNNAAVSTNAAAIATKKADEAMESANVAINASEEIDIKINGFNESYENIKEEIIEEGEKQLQNIESTGFYMRDDKLYFINSKGEEEEFKSGGSGFNLFDTIISDHILEGNKAKGRALQGTYVSGDLYPDFYNTCLNEYKDENNTKFCTQVNVNTYGSLTIDNGILSGFNATNYATLPNKFTPENKSWEMVFKATVGSSSESYMMIIGNNTADKDTGVALAIRTSDYTLRFWVTSNNSSWDVLGASGATVFETGKTYYFKIEFTGTEYNAYYSTDNNTWIREINVASTTPASVLQIHKIGASHSGNYFAGSIDLKECYINIDNKRWWTGGSLVIQNKNTHQFYPISDKPLIDNIYNQYGIAEYYGIDEENKRIFLPRNNFFAVTGGVKGNGTGIGLTDGTNYATIVESSEQIYARKNYGENVGTVTSTTGSLVNNSILGLTPDPTKSGIELVPNKNKYLYYCVGNTVVNDAEINAGGLAAQVELKANINLDNITNAAKTNIANISLPSDKFINLTLGASGTKYTAPADGYFFLAKITGSDKIVYIGMYNQKAGLQHVVWATQAQTSNTYDCIFPAKKGDEIMVSYNFTGATSAFKFFYAVGSESEAE